MAALGMFTDALEIRAGRILNPAGRHSVLINPVLTFPADFSGFSVVFLLLTFSRFQTGY